MTLYLEWVSLAIRNFVRPTELLTNLLGDWGELRGVELAEAGLVEKSLAILGSFLTSKLSCLDFCEAEHKNLQFLRVFLRLE